MIAALRACGALSPASPVPGQVAAACAALNVTGHGIAAPPARDLPEPWLSMLAHGHRTTAREAVLRDGCAAAAIALPEVDGVSLAILGVHTCQARTVVHVHASGPACYAINVPDDLIFSWPAIWIRDSSGRWHATRIIGRAGMSGETAMRLQVTPPLSRSTAWIEVLAVGQSAEARAVLPLRWY